MITVLGGGGFIGSHLVRHLDRLGLEWQAPRRDEPLAGRALGNVIYCIGLTADFRERPADAIEAHVCRLLDLVRSASFDSLLYLSSARLYLRSDPPAREEDELRVRPADPHDIYHLSKAAGEALTLSLGAKGRVARLSNVYGPGQDKTFLAMLLQEVRESGTIALQTAPESAKDYVSVEDVVDLLVKIALGGRHAIYNVASGVSVTNAELTAAIARHSGCEVRIRDGAPTVSFPAIDVERVRSEFGFSPRSVLDDLPALIASGA
ncbi:MAG TPA: NAD-dependent epimerase/dehydratase family protein [Allosphingosinicella sp.]